MHHCPNAYDHASAVRGCSHHNRSGSATALRAAVLAAGGGEKEFQRRVPVHVRHVKATDPTLQRRAVGKTEGVFGGEGYRPALGPKLSRLLEKTEQRVSRMNKLEKRLETIQK